MAFDNVDKHQVYDLFTEYNNFVLPKNIHLDVDGKQINLNEVLTLTSGGYFQTTIGWHTIVARLGDGKPVTKKIFAYPPSNDTPYSGWSQSEDQYNTINALVIKMRD